MKKLLPLLLCAVFLLSACQPVDLDAPVPVYDTGIDPESWALIPAGEFLSGQFDKETDIPYDYEMMVTPVTNDQYAAYLNAALADGSVKVSENQIVGFYPGDVFNGGRHEEEIAAGDYIYIPLDDPALRLAFDGSAFSAKPGWGSHPMTMVSWFGAKAYCEAAGGRLPSELEWEKAARGSADNRPFPWGETITRNRANLIFSRDPFENMATFGSRTTPVGFYNGQVYDGYQTLDSPSPYGLYDMAGNVWQWTGDVYEAQHYRYMRGGGMNNYENALRVWARNNATPVFTGPATGFRCARGGK